MVDKQTSVVIRNGALPLSRNKTVWVVLLIVISIGCRAAAERSNSNESKQRVDKPSLSKEVSRATTQSVLKSEWDASVGKGAVIHKTASGDFLRTCFHCDYAGYTGGLIIGAYNGSGLGFYPHDPIRGHKEINLFCAADESIWDIDEQQEYTYGWSENFGRGDDGVPLRYVNGQVVENKNNRLVLRSTNAAGCYRVTKVAYTRADVLWWIIATRIDNTCHRPIVFDLFSGDDPWLGRYRTSEGDIGWTPEGLVRNETFLGLGQFEAGGIYDLGNQTLGQNQADFTNQANFIQVDPAVELPDKTFFANSFAHRQSDINPSRALDNKTRTALNLGWTNRRLAPNEGFTTAMAVGKAVTGTPGSIPRIPKIDEADWSVWRKYLNQDRTRLAPTVLFASESVDIDIQDKSATITGSYFLRDSSGVAASVAIVYPIITSTDLPAPEAVLVDGQMYPVNSGPNGSMEARFTVQVPAFGIKRFEVRYTQVYRKKRVAYMVTSAKNWPLPLTRATFRVKHRRTLTKVRTSYPIQFTTKNEGIIEHRITLQPFSPDREFEVFF